MGDEKEDTVELEPKIASVFELIGDEIVISFLTKNGVWLPVSQVAVDVKENAELFRWPFIFRVEAR